MADPILRLDGVSVTFGALKAVDGVSLAVQAGERRAIIGPNGAGKTTLFNAIAGSVSVSSGTIIFGRRKITRLRVDRRATLGIGRTFQITNLFADLTVAANMQLAVWGLSSRKFSCFGNPMPQGAERETVERALTDSGLSAKRDVLTRTLSYGEQRQLELALALAGKPKLLLLDEPAAGLSPAERVTMAAVISRLPRDLTLVLIEHDMDLALRLVDSVTCLYSGQVLVEASPDAIRRDSRVQEVYLGKPHHA